MRIVLSALLSLGAFALCVGCGASRTASPRGSSSRAPATDRTNPFASSTSPTASVGGIAPPKYASVPAGARVRSGTVQVAYRNITIQPDVLRVKAGSTIRWTNFDSVEHTVTSRGGPATFSSGPLRPGASFQVRLPRPGVVHYLCTIHPATMNATIEVVR
jgi:plastocyanin